MTNTWGQAEWFRSKLKNQGSDSGAAYFGHAKNAYQAMRHQWILKNTLSALPFQPDQIFDFGCAVGELTAAFAREIPEAKAYGYDFIEELIEQATKDHPNVEFGVNALPQITRKLPKNSLTILSEVLYYLPQEQRTETIDNLSSKSSGPQAVALSSVVGEQYFNVNSATTILKKHYPNVEVFSFSMPIYKRLYGYCQSYESLCGLAEANKTDERKIVRLCQTGWRIAPTRWLMKLARFFSRLFVSSSFLVAMSRKIEGRNTPHSNASNILVIAHRDA